MSRIASICFGLLLIPNPLVSLGHGQVLNESVASINGLVAVDGEMIEKDLMFKKPRQRFELRNFLNRCNNLIINGDARNTAHWDVVGSGIIKVEDSAFIHSERIAVSHGPSQTLDHNCFAEGLRYRYNAKMNVLNEKGEYMLCDKHAPWGTYESCPLVIMKLEFEDGGVQWVHLFNSDTSEWKLDEPNPYRSEFVVTKGMATAQKISVIITGLRSGISMKYGSVGIYPECKNLITDGDAEASTPKDWLKWGPVKTKVVSPGADSTPNAFEMTGRARPIHGVFDRIRVECFVIGTRLEFKGKFKLKDATGKPYECNPASKMWAPDACVYFGILLETHDGKRTWHFLGNDAAVPWVAEDWNKFHRIFTVTEDMATAKYATAHILGPGRAIDVIFDEIQLIEYFAPEMDCNGEMVLNGRMDNGHFADWQSEGDSSLMITSGEPFNSNYAVQINGRKKRLDGLRQELDITCFLKVGKQIVLNADVKIMKDNGEATLCEPGVNCPFFILEMVRFGGKVQRVIFDGVTIHRPTQNDQFVYKMHRVYRVATMFQWAKHVSLIICGASRGEIMVVDNISIRSLDSDDSCSEIATNVKKTTRNGPGWAVYGNGIIDVKPEDIVISNRRHHSHGLKQLLDITCFERDKRYKLTSQVELLDRKGRPFVCDPNQRWGQPYFCPLFSIKLIQTGSKNTIYLRNQSPYSWHTDGYNLYESVFTVDADMAGSEMAYLMVFGPHKTVSIALKNITIEEYEPVQPNCIDFIANGDAELGTLDHWQIFGRSRLSIASEGALGSENSFLSTRRKVPAEGMMQELVVKCLTEGVRLEVNAWIKLYKSGEAFTCDKTARYGQPTACPVISIKFLVPSAPKGFSWLHITNDDPFGWKPRQFNQYRGNFVVTSEMTTSTEAYLYVYGVSGGIDMLVDKVTLRPYQPPTTACNQLIRNGDAESLRLDTWNSLGSGSMVIYDQGPGTPKAYQQINRRSPSHGPEQEISVACLEFGKMYEINARVKLVVGSEMKPYDCDKTVQGNDPLMCPIASLRLNVMGLTLVENMVNDYAESWKPDDFNWYHSIFTVNPDIADSDSAFFYIRGPQKGVSIIFDDVSVSEYFGHEEDCRSLIKNGDAEFPRLDGWIAGGSGYYDFIKDQRGGHYLQYSKRKSRNDGPRQRLDVGCLDDNVTYDFSAKILLTDLNGEAYSCNNFMQARTETSCVDATFELRFGTEKKFERKWNEDPAEWSSFEFNDFRFSFKVSKDMREADEVYLTIAGSVEETMILIDDASLTARFEKDAACAYIINGDAESSSFLGWNVFNRVGSMKLIEGGANGSSFAFKQIDRSNYRNGVTHLLDFSCRVHGDVFELEFQYKLEDSEGNPFVCNKKSDATSSRCMDTALRLTNSDGSTWVLLTNTDYSDVVENEFTSYHAQILVTSEMISSDSVTLLMYGPDAGISIIFDEVRLYQTGGYQSYMP